MPTDASIYGNVQTPKIDIPNPLDMAQKSMQLSQLGMQQMHMARELQNQSAIQSAYMKHTDPATGQLDQTSVLSELGKTAPLAAQTVAQQFAAQNKAQAEAKSAQIEAAQKTVSFTGPAFDYMKKMPEDQRAAAYPSLIAQLKDQGVDVSRMDHPYDSGKFEQYWGAWREHKQSLENQLAEANIAKTQAEVGEKQKARLTEYQKMLGSDESYKKASGMLSEGNNAISAVNDALKNPGSAANIPIMLARFTSAGSRMNENEIEANVKAGNFGDQLKQMYTKSRTGVLTDTMADYAKQFVSQQMKSAAQNKLSIENDYAGKYAIDAGLPMKVAYGHLTAKLPGTVTKTPEGPARFSGKGKDTQEDGVVTSANASEKRAASSIKKGEVYKGHVFNGGDPTDQRNWKKVSK